MNDPLVPKASLDDPECAEWEEEPSDYNPASVNAGQVPSEDAEGGLCVAIISLCAALPALVGSWCWPILVGAMFAVAANNISGGLIDFFHAVQVVIDFALLTNILQFAWWKCKAKKNLEPGHWNRYGPCYVLMVATVLVLVQPTCLLVITSFGIENFFFTGDDDNALVPTTTVGVLIQVFCTYGGFLFMFWGVIWSTNLHVKISRKWAIIRARQQAAREAMPVAQAVP